MGHISVKKIEDIPPAIAAEFIFRFMKGTRKNGCWYLEGKVGIPHYAQVYKDGNSALGHVLSYVLLRKKIIRAGYEIHHKCEHKGCVDPDHSAAVRPKRHRRIHARSEAARLASWEAVSRPPRVVVGGRGPAYSTTHLSAS